MTEPIADPLTDIGERLDAERRRIAQVLAAPQSPADGLPAIRPAADATDAPVPTCPGWTGGDLLAHVDDVESRWAQRLPDASPEQLRRRVLHELTVHRLDAELTAAPDGSLRSPVDALVAQDGVDEALRLIHGPWHDWEPGGGHGPLRPIPGRAVRVVATDTGETWLVQVATDVPAGGPGAGGAGAASYPTGVLVAGADHADGTVRPDGVLSGSAEDLYAWLWHRPLLGELRRAGDQGVVTELESVVAARPLV